MGTQLPQKKGTPHLIFGLCLLCPNGGMDQDATWYGGKPQRRRRCVRWCRSLRLKGAEPPVFVSCLLDEDCTWYGSRPRPRPHCIRRGPISRERGTAATPPCGPCLLWPRSPIAELWFYLIYMVLECICKVAIARSLPFKCPVIQSSS